eukprot:10584234-Karenia_brevis.AAC.1
MYWDGCGTCTYLDIKKLLGRTSKKYLDDPGHALGRTSRMYSDDSELVRIGMHIDDVLGKTLKIDLGGTLKMYWEGL